MNEVDRLFSALAAYGEELAAQRKEKRARQRAAANARRRRLYANRKAAGTLPVRNSPVVEREPEFDAPTTCYCHTCTMPPCSWCESGSVVDAEETP